MEAVIGSRTIESFDFNQLELNHVITGGAKGIDQAIEKFCKEKGIPCTVIEPNYALGRGAPLIRNKLIVDTVDTIYAIWDGKSPGTKHVIQYAIKKGKIIHVYICNERGEILPPASTEKTISQLFNEIKA